jgi:ElaB/YqjD/DUF883 family membrane-anchored ribosome-binding protein
MPDFRIPDISTDVTKAAKDVAAVAKDATYVVIGAGVLGFQKAQVQREELRKRLGDPKSTVEVRLASAKADFQQAVHTVDARVEDIIQRIEAAIVPIEDRLPTPARDLAKQAHVQAKEARSQVRTKVVTFAG